MSRVRVPRPISGGLLLTYKCSAACRHCMYACSPKWRADWISGEDLEELKEIFRELLEFQKQHDTVKSNATFLNNIVNFFADGGIPGCRAGERFMVVNPDGTFSPCGLITTDFKTRGELTEKFVVKNTCTGCNTSIRAWTERPFSTFFSAIRPAAGSF